MVTTARIVLIDDNKAWRETLAEYLRAEGFEVWAAGDAGHGMALLDKVQVDVIVCDYHLPGMDGLQLLRHLQRHRTKTALVMLSSDEAPSLPAQALAAGAFDLLTKSTAPRLLLRRIRQIAESLSSTSAQAYGGTLALWQRLLPSPQRSRGRRGTNRPAARSPKEFTNRSSKSPF